MGSELAITTRDRDVEVIIDSTVNMPAWCSVVVKKKATRMLGIIRKEIENKTKNHHYARILITVFNSAALISERIYVELEETQRNTIKMIKGLAQPPNKEQLMHCDSSI